MFFETWDPFFLALDDVMSILFAEELGLVLEVDESDITKVKDAYGDVPCSVLGFSTTYDDPSLCQVEINKFSALYIENL